MESPQMLVPVTIERVIAPWTLHRRYALYLWIAQPATLGLLTWWQPLAGLLVHAVLLLMAVVLGARRARLSIGEDGLHLRWWNVERFLSYAEIAEVTKAERGVTLRLRSDEKVPLLAQFYGGHLREHLSFQLEARMDRWQQWPALERLLPPKDGSAYREPQATADDVVKAAVNPRTPPEVRVEATRMLRGEAISGALRALAESAEATANVAARRALLGLIESAGSSSLTT
jgi:hypothetical protein